MRVVHPTLQNLSTLLSTFFHIVHKNIAFIMKGEEQNFKQDILMILNILNNSGRISLGDLKRLKKWIFHIR